MQCPTPIPPPRTHHAPLVSHRCCSWCCCCCCCCCCWRWCRCWCCKRLLEHSVYRRLCVTAPVAPDAPSPMAKPIADITPDRSQQPPSRPQVEVLSSWRQDGCTIFGEGKQDDLHVESDTAAQHSAGHRSARQHMLTNALVQQEDKRAAASTHMATHTAKLARSVSRP